MVPEFIFKAALFATTKVRLGKREEEGRWTVGEETTGVKVDGWTDPKKAGFPGIFFAGNLCYFTGKTL